MGPHRAAGLIAFLLLVQPALAQTPGWHYSPLPGEGDRATLGCDRDATQTSFTCLAVRCEDDFTTGIHVYSSRPLISSAWEMTIDRENALVAATTADTPYSARLDDQSGWLLDRLREGTFIYLRQTDDSEQGFAYISLGGSLRAIHSALAYCAPRVPPSNEPKAVPGV